MSENVTTVESPSARSTVAGVVREVRHRFAAALAALSVPRLGAAALAAMTAYFVFVVPAEFVLLFAAVAGTVVLAAMIPITVVTAVVWFVK